MDFGLDIYCGFQKAEDLEKCDAEYITVKKYGVS